ncbi:DNA polymerase (family 10) [Halovenus aranensis]|uniref:DNA polymerase beta n=1 Tax=Halovenus aranensis TaxID=890420 RepID=A0A1G8SXI7_9EURY|nr:DNA polymerase/3'-5' exonuclease PolX [Halovenus aranensis]SDJ33894.1 DNA polymerase (family 10) [Halovenus aranensis]
MTRNDEVAALLEEFAMRLDAQGVDYKPRAYERAAESIRDHTVDIEALAAEGTDAVAEIDDVGDAISSKVVEYLETGEIAELEELRAELPVEIDALTRVEGVGPRTVGQLYEELGVQTLDDLEATAEAGEIQDLRGFGEKTEQNILDGIPFAREAHERQLLGEARPRGERVRTYLADHDAVSRCELAGSIRRWKPTIGDVDVLVGSDNPEAVIDAFTDYPDASAVIEAGSTKASIRVGAVRVDVRVVAPEEFGAALQYFTGSKDHNVAVRNRALDRGLKINEYGVFDVSALADDRQEHQRAGERVGGETETEMYEAVSMAWVPPELREDRGEVAAAAGEELPALVEPEDLRGDLHTHTEWSDGDNTVAEMVAAAADFGHEYVCLTDHATGPGMVGGVGLSDAEIRDQRAEIRAAEDEADIDVLAGIEANIDADGAISVGDDVLAELDLIVASPHADLDGDGTDRLAAAARHPEVDIIGHPTGRQLNQREGMDVDIERLGAVAAEHGTALEINANPNRLDLAGRLVQRAVEQGATVAVNTDAHRPSSYDFARYGVHVARRGWAEPDDVLNAWPIAEVRSFLS